MYWLALKFSIILRDAFFMNNNSLLFSHFLCLFLGQNSLLGGIFQWISWLLHDSCYDPTVFGISLREAFGKAHCNFDIAGSWPELHSKSKLGVIATTIAKETKSLAGFTTT